MRLYVSCHVDVDSSVAANEYVLPPSTIASPPMFSRGDATVWMGGVGGARWNAAVDAVFARCGRLFGRGAYRLDQRLLFPHAVR